MKSKDFKYDRQSEKMLQELKKVAELEGYSEQAQQEFEALSSKLVHNIDFDLDHSRPEIQQYLEQEIAKRYYYPTGEIIQTLKNEEALNKVLEILGNQNEYKNTLNIFTAKTKKK